MSDRTDTIAPTPPASAQSKPAAVVRHLETAFVDGKRAAAFLLDETLPDGTHLYTKAQSVEPVAVAIHHVKLKTRKRIDAEIPRTMQGWWADVCPGKRMVLRDAHAADIARCHIDEGQSRDPKDYLCELSDTGWLVARIAIDTIRTEMVPVGVITDAKRVEHVAMVRKLVNMSIIDSTGCKTSWEDLPDGTKLYTTPPSAEGVLDAVLTPGEVDDLYKGHLYMTHANIREIEIAVIRALKSKKGA